MIYKEIFLPKDLLLSNLKSLEGFDNRTPLSFAKSPSQDFFHFEWSPPVFANFIHTDACTL